MTKFKKSYFWPILCRPILGIFQKSKAFTVKPLWFPKFINLTYERIQRKCVTEGPKSRRTNGQIRIHRIFTERRDRNRGQRNGMFEYYSLRNTWCRHNDEYKKNIVIFEAYFISLTEQNVPQQSMGWQMTYYIYKALHYVFWKKK